LKYGDIGSWMTKNKMFFAGILTGIVIVLVIVSIAVFDWTIWLGILILVGTNFGAVYYNQRVIEEQEEEEEK